MQMKRKTITLTLILAAGCALALGVAYFAYVNSPLGIIARGNPNAGTWLDDSGNWKRAFGKAPPVDLTVVHSYYWESDHFTTEFIYFFEVKAPAAWRNTFLAERGVGPVSPTNARGFEVGYDETPAWFVPPPVTDYDVWDRPGYHGSVWLNRTNEHFYFYGVQL